MKLINHQLYLEMKDAIRCGLGKSENHISKEKSRGAKWAVFINDPNDQRKILIEYDSLHPKKKEMVDQVYGNPYENFAKEPLRKMMVKDLKAEKFFIDYKHNETESLSKELRDKYTTAASWLNLFVKVKEDKNYIKQTLGITIAKFWLEVGEMIKQDQIDLPSCYRRLIEKIDEYKKEGYACLISKKIGNTSAKKVKDEISSSLLLQLVSMPNADDVMTARRYNKWAAENNREQITSRTVTNYKNNNLHLITLEKKGNRINYNFFGKHIIRQRPSAPLLLVEHDDNELDLYFQSKGNYFNRFVLAVVTDPFNDYILGWAIAPTYTKELIRFAYLDAVYHIRELTGGWYLPNQIRSDRFGLDAKAENDLGQFYKSLAIYTPATAKVARGKYIERSFGDLWHQALSCYKNYAGTNVKSKYQTNEEFRDATKKDYPSTDQAPAQAAQFIHTLRHVINNKTGLSKQEEWVKAFKENDKSKMHCISEIQVLAKLGTPHAFTNKITNRGITPTINGIERYYELPEKYFLETIGSTVQIIYDPMDFSRVLITDNQKLLFIAREQELMPSAIADFKPGDRTKINDRLAEKSRHMKQIMDAKQEREDTLELAGIRSESLLMAGIHSKAINHKALIEYEPASLEEPIKRNRKQIDKPSSLDDMLDKM